MKRYYKCFEKILEDLFGSLGKGAYLCARVNQRACIPTLERSKGQALCRKDLDRVKRREECGDSRIFFIGQRECPARQNHRG